MQGLPRKRSRSISASSEVLPLCPPPPAPPQRLIRRSACACALALLHALTLPSFVQVQALRNTCFHSAASFLATQGLLLCLQLTNGPLP